MKKDKTGITGIASQAIIEILIFSLVINILMLVLPLYMLQVYDRILTSGSLNTLIYISIIACVALVLLGFLDYIRARYAARVAAKIEVALGTAGFQAAMRSMRASIGDIQPLRDLTTVRNFISSRSFIVFFDLPFAPLFLFILFLIHPDLFWFSMIGLGAPVAVAIFNQSISLSSSKQAGEASMQSLLSAQSFARNAETLRAMGMEQNAERIWGTQHAIAANHSDTGSAINAALGGLSKVIRFFLQIGILGYGGYLVLIGEMSAGMIFAASIVSGKAFQPVDQIIGIWPQINPTLTAWKRFKASIATNPVEPDKTALAAPLGAISVQDLVYAVQSPDGARPIIKGIRFDVKPGSVIAVIGPSGAGKSTLARLLVGAIEPRSGVVRIDGSDLKNWEREFLGRHIGYLPQQVELFPGTISENISRFDEGASDDAIRLAAVNAHAEDLVKELGRGYDTLVGPGGIELSGGQRQRIGLARALYGQPRIMVLDEPNANLDEDGEAALAKAVLAARDRGTTVIVVAQRLGLTGLADGVLEMAAGQIVDFGPRDQVMARFAERRAKRTGAPAPSVPTQAGSAPRSGPGSHTLDQIKSMSLTKVIGSPTPPGTPGGRIGG